MRAYRNPSPGRPNSVLLLQFHPVSNSLVAIAPQCSSTPKSWHLVTFPFRSAALLTTPFPPHITGSDPSLPQLLLPHLVFLPRAPSLAPSPEPETVLTPRSATGSQNPTEKQKLNRGASRRHRTCTNSSNRPQLYTRMGVRTNRKVIHIGARPTPPLPTSYRAEMLGNVVYFCTLLSGRRM